MFALGVKVAPFLRLVRGADALLRESDARKVEAGHAYGRYGRHGRGIGRRSRVMQAQLDLHGMLFPKKKRKKNTSLHSQFLRSIHGWCIYNIENGRTKCRSFWKWKKESDGSFGELTDAGQDTLSVNRL